MYTGIKRSCAKNLSTEWLKEYEVPLYSVDEQDEIVAQLDAVRKIINYRQAHNVTKLKDISVYVPPMDLQDEFVCFVKQVDKSKVAVQKALNETQILFDSLMQEYFG